MNAADRYFSSLDRAAASIHQLTFLVASQMPEWNDPIRVCRKCLQPFTASKARWKANVTGCPHCHRPFPKQP